MIFVTFGNVPIPFKRLARKVDELAGVINEEFIVQHGYTNYPFKNVKAHQFFSSDEMLKLMNDATIIITHGGYGTISECLKKGKKVIAVPRIQGEHNHSQGELVRRLESKGCIVGVYNINDLGDKILYIRTFKPKPIKKGDDSKIINKFIQNLSKNN